MRIFFANTYARRYDRCMEFSRINQKNLITFEGEEVEAVGLAFNEWNNTLNGLAGADIVPEYHERIAKLRGNLLFYICDNTSHLNEVLTNFDYSTEHVVEEVLNCEEDESRIDKVAKRYKMQRHIQELQFDIGLEVTVDEVSLNTKK